MKTIYKEKLMYTFQIFMALFGAIYPIFKLKFKPNETVDKFITVICGICALSLVFERDVYLPFLGDCVVPQQAFLIDRLPARSNKIVRIKVPPKVKVIYWAAEPGDTIAKSPWEAYKNYRNTGVTRSDIEGKATLRFRYPRGYKTPKGETIRPHVHYRYMRNGGMMSAIKTVYV